MLTDGLHTYTYDAENRIIAVTDQGATYKYDPEGMRVATLSGSTVTAEYLYDTNGDFVTTITNQGMLMRAILRANRTHWGDYIGAAGPGGVKTVFRLVNQVGTLIADADTRGNLIEGCLSGPFGDGQTCTSTYDYTETHFADKVRDQETANDYFGARNYNSTMGRWLSADTVNVTDDRLVSPSNTLNKYAYGASNPLKYIDPDGKDITIFYESPHLQPDVSPGHTMLLAYNQQTGDSDFKSFGPDYADGATRLGAIVGTPGTDTFGALDYASADAIRATFASLTIQTTPEEAQAVINEIRLHPDGKYNILTNNCTTTCSKLLYSIGKVHSINLTPSGFFSSLFDKYATLPQILNRVVLLQDFVPGSAYGVLRDGYDPFSLLLGDFRRLQRERVTVTIIDPDTHEDFGPPDPN